MKDNFALDCRALTKCFGDFIADNALTFTVPKREIFGLIGPNGAGKTTLIKMLTTVLPPSAGDAMVEGVSIKQHPAKVREIIGYVPQMLSTDGNLTGYENLLIAAKLYNIPRHLQKKRVEEALEQVGLAAMAHNYVSEYSGGMIRRLEIIQAMLHKPKVLFLDEPTSGLDPVARKNVWAHLNKIHNEEGVTIILTTHDMYEAEQLCNRIAILLRGNIAVIGDTDELKKSVGPTATLDDVFVHYAGDIAEVEHAYAESLIRRRTESRRGS